MKRVRSSLIQRGIENNYPDSSKISWTLAMISIAPGEPQESTVQHDTHSYSQYFYNDYYVLVQKA